MRVSFRPQSFRLVVVYVSFLARVDKLRSPQRNGTYSSGSCAPKPSLHVREHRCVLYPSLVSLVEKERRNGISTKRFKYAGAIDMSKCYPKSGSLDDCALLRPVGEVNSIRFNTIDHVSNIFFSILNRRHITLCAPKVKDTVSGCFTMYWW